MEKEIKYPKEKCSGKKQKKSRNKNKKSKKQNKYINIEDTDSNKTTNEIEIKEVNEINNKQKIKQNTEIKKEEKLLEETEIIERSKENTSEEITNEEMNINKQTKQLEKEQINLEEIKNDENQQESKVLLSIEEKNEIIKNILSELQDDKDQLKLQNDKDEDKEEIIKKHKRYTSIEIDENYKYQNESSKTENTEILEVKNKKYKKDIPIEDYILYDGFKFRKDTHLNKNHPKIINYRCINYRKNERIRNTQFCNAFVIQK